MVSAEKLDKIEQFLNKKIFEYDLPILTQEKKDLLDDRLANHKANSNKSKSWDVLKSDLSKYAS